MLRFGNICKVDILFWVVISKPWPINNHSDLKAKKNLEMLHRSNFYSFKIYSIFKNVIIKGKNICLPISKEHGCHNSRHPSKCDAFV
jgi:hypothetical protein